jgi:predicted component of type VI protein secretion system
MKLSLEVLTSGKQEGKILEVKLTQFVIGRDPQCHLRPASPMISKRHCAVIQRDGKVFLRDFGSTNGSFVNDERVQGEVELKHDDRLKVGPLLFAVRLEATAPVNRPTPPPATRPADKSAVAAARPKAPAAAEGTPPPATKSDDDDIAAMLLSLADDDIAASPASADDEVPQGSTQMEIPAQVAPGGSEPAAAGKDAKDKDKGKKEASPANTASAAKSILEKMMKRPRT